jgi:hypothetical protein
VFCLCSVKVLCHGKIRFLCVKKIPFLCDRKLYLSDANKCGQQGKRTLYPLRQASYGNMKYCAIFTAVREEPETIWGNSTDLNAVLKSPFEERSDYIARSTTKWGIQQSFYA